MGRLGILHLKSGYYAYTGSARGSGGFKRIYRHLNVLCGRNMTRKWHIDHLLPITSFRCAVASSTDQDLECVVAKGIGLACEPVLGFGCTDCSCISHLHFSYEYEYLLDTVMQAHFDAGLSPSERVGPSLVATNTNSGPPL
ncbi:MAG: GIY-YIG nuclease family protein [Euryarchaeota archaeon]|nr:GIY-YIG nuclease family protein [Euryarchaeota archaeon]